MLQSSTAPFSNAADQKTALRKAESKFRSQFDEDGIIAFLLDRLGNASKRFVEFGIGNGKECNTANLSINRGWSGLLMDGNAADVEKARNFYGSSSAAGKVRIEQAFISAGNINDLLRQHLDESAVDLLSIDIDGQDLWVWKAIDAIAPRIVVIEYNAVFGTSRSQSVVLDPVFDRFKHHPSGLYHGASLAALAKVGREKGFILVGCESHGVNAFFVEQHAASDAGLVELSPQEAWFEHAWRAERFGAGSSESQFDQIREMPLVEI
jgi:hypothetical protein